MVIYLVSIISLQICNFMWQNFILTISIYSTVWQSFIGGKYFKFCQNLSSRNYGSVWQGFVETSHLRFSLSGVNLDKPFLWNRVTEYRWDKPLLLTENKSNFTFRVKAQAIEGLREQASGQTIALTTSRRARKAARRSLRFFFYCTNQNGLIQSKESGAVRKGQAFQVI